MNVQEQYTIQMSAKVPPALAKGDEPNVPAINREMISMAERSDNYNRDDLLGFFARAQGIWKTVKTAQDIRYTGRLPRASDMGAQTNGPNAKPKT